MIAISVRNVSKTYQGCPILKSVSFDVTSGSTVGLIGMNGCGKSVLMQIIAGLVKADCGEVYVNGKQIGKEVDYPNDTGILINGPAFIPYYSARQNLALLAAYRNQISKEEIDAVICKVGLDPRKRKGVGKYSTGMKVRLGIAQAIMENPQVLLLDEPFNGLDHMGVEDMYRILCELRENGKTILLTSHIKENIDRLCDSVLELNEGVVQKADENGQGDR